MSSPSRVKAHQLEPGADGQVLGTVGTSVEWVDGASGAVTFNNQTGTSYTVALADAAPGAWLVCDNAAPFTLTVPENSTTPFPVGSYIPGHQEGAGQVEVVGAGSVVINAAPGPFVAEQYGSFFLLKQATDTWLLVGRLAA